MKKIYFLFLLSVFSLFSFSQVIITEIADPNNNAEARFIELHNLGATAVDFTEGNGWQIDKYTNASADVSISIDLTGTIPAGGFYIIAYNNTDGTFATVYGFAPDQLDDVNNGVAGSNGDDDLFLVDGTDAIVDAFGVTGVDNTGSCAEYEDGRAERLTTITAGSVAFNEAEWNIWADSDVTGCTSHQNAPRTAPGDYDPGAWGTETCGLALINPSAVCDAITMGTDTYTATVDFTGGGTSTYTVTADSGTVDLSGGNPTTDETGTITVTGVTEGSDVVINVQDGAICDIDSTIFAAECVPSLDLPLYEGFDYTVAENLGDQPNWSNSNSGDEIVIGGPGGLSYTNLASSTQTGNHIAFDGAGIDPSIEFTAVTSGTVYASFLMNITDNTAATSAGYFAILGDFDVRLWVVPGANAGEYQLGVSNVNTAPTAGALDTNVLTTGATVLVVLSYDVATGTMNAWINPSDSSFGGTAPAASATETAANIAPSVNQFLIRQDSETETPFILFDELRVGTSYADVTPTTLSNEEFTMADLRVYPNPTDTGVVNITSSKAGTMMVQVFDILGKQVKNDTLTTSNSLNVSSLKAGVYIMRITQNNTTSTKKLVIK
ncbi:MAG: T9SS type A sorting domain-containing protein [Winogradskyella sp.]|uniref:T9SS type A sorting domain-containing protein n=1 Tax=Winogradskyella sp. TaxID=1883156 RepID=UPI00385DB77E